MNRNSVYLLVGGVVSLAWHCIGIPDMVAIIPLGLGLVVYFGVEGLKP